MTTKYITRRGKIFLTNNGYTFRIKHKEQEYEIVSKYSIICYGDRHAFETALEMNDLEQYAVEMFRGIWN